MLGGLWMLGALGCAATGCELDPPGVVAPTGLTGDDGSTARSQAPVDRALPTRAELTPARFALAAAPADAVAGAEVEVEVVEPEGPPTEVRTWKLGKEDSARSGKVRDQLAFASKEAEVKALFDAAGVAFPPRRVLFRVFKAEMELEVWASDAADAPLKPITTYRICAASGGPGPKTRSGDGQVPEGFYEIDFFKPRSDYYLALHVNYPNRRDLAQRSTGSAIMIHGRCASIGCLAMSDDRIQELWVIGKSLRSGRVQVHIFPERAIDGLVDATEHAALKAFWASLAEGKRRFDADHRVPKKIGFDDDGNYTFD
ncbi:MAG: L,D-transpeptidase family protein [Nannocystaceae bacterium]